METRRRGLRSSMPKLTGNGEALKKSFQTLWLNTLVSMRKIGVRLKGTQLRSKGKGHNKGLRTR